MLYTQFPLPVSIDEACLVVHRALSGEHQELRTCWCCPAIFTPDELDALTAEQLNMLVRHGTQ